MLFRYLLFVNTLTFVLWGYDKYKAIQHHRRIAEKTFFRLILFGGGGGALIGQQLFRHKTIKQSFLQTMYLLICIWIIVVLVGLVY